MIPARNVTITIGGISIRLGDIADFQGNEVILRNGMRIKTTEFALEAARKRVKELTNAKTEKNNPRFRN